MARKPPSGWAVSSRPTFQRKTRVLWENSDKVPARNRVACASEVMGMPIGALVAVFVTVGVALYVVLIIRRRK